MLTPEELYDIKSSLAALQLPFGGEGPELRRIMMSALAMKPEVRPLPYHRFGYPSYLEPDRPTYNINSIPGTRLFISEGPAPCYAAPEREVGRGNDPSSMSRFMSATVFHPTDPIQLFLVAGSPDEGAQFEPYFLLERSYDGPFRLKPLRPARRLHTRGSLLSHQVQVTHHHESRVLELVQVPLMPDFSTATLEDVDVDALLDLYLRAAHENLNVHCAAGLGRSGLLVLAYQLFQRFEELLELDDAAARAVWVARGLTQLRNVRPGAVQTQEQLEQALEIAHALAHRVVQRSMG